MAAKAKMKYHHLERCFTNRVKRPVVFRGLRAPDLLGLGIYPVVSPLSRESLVGFTRPRSRLFWATGSGIVRTQPWRALYQAFLPPGRKSRVLSRDICQMGSLAGAAYLLHDNAGVLRQAQWEQNSHVEHKRKGLLD